MPKFVYKNIYFEGNFTLVIEADTEAVANMMLMAMVQKPEDWDLENNNEELSSALFIVESIVHLNENIMSFAERKLILDMVEHFRSTLQ